MDAPLRLLSLYNLSLVHSGGRSSLTPSSHLAGSFEVLLADARADRRHLYVLWRADISPASLESLTGTLVVGHLGHLVRCAGTFDQG